MVYFHEEVLIFYMYLYVNDLRIFYILYYLCVHFFIELVKVNWIKRILVWKPNGKFVEQNDDMPNQLYS